MDPMLKLLREFINQTGFAVWTGGYREVSCELLNRREEGSEL
jgi:hypothetical protein